MKTKEGSEERELKYLGSQLQQSVLSQLQFDVRALSARKKKGHKVGALKYVSEVNSINLQQRKVTYDIDLANSSIRVQKLGWLRVRGIRQLRNVTEFANAKLIKKASGYYIAITCYYDPASATVPVIIGNGSIGVDFGVSSHLTLSNGEKWSSTIKESERLKRLQRKLQRSAKHSNNWNKTRTLLQREYEKLTNKKNDQANQIVHKLLQYETVFFQDELLSSWRKKDGFVRGGRRLQYSSLGLVKAKLKVARNAMMLSSSVATTQTCVCGVKNKHELSQRTYSCSCGYSLDRDVHAALNMVRLGQVILAENYSPGGSGGALVERKLDDTKVLLFSAKQETESFAGESSEAAKSSA